MIGAKWRANAPRFLILDSREAILDLGPALEALAERCDQAGAMHWLPYFLDRAVTGCRTPLLVLRLRTECGPGVPLKPDDLEAAAMFFEYRILGLRIGAVATADAVGFTSVIAPGGERTRMAGAAARALIERGAAVVLATCEGDAPLVQLSRFPTLAYARFAFQQRSVGRVLPLLASLDATLAQMGKSTRFNLRYYRRRLEREHRCEYVADAVPALAGLDLQELNAASLNPVAPEEFARRVRCATELPGSFLSGLRTRDGRWLSLVGGWRQADTVVLHWQTNAAGFERYSLCTAMRSFLLEHEIGRGAKKLLIYGGTSHPMSRAFKQDAVVDLLVQRGGVQAAALRWAARFVATPGGVTGKGNLLAGLLRDRNLAWTSGRTPRPLCPFPAKLASAPGGRTPGIGVL